MTNREYVEGYPVVSNPTREALNDRQLLDYRHHKRDFLEWAASVGKNPEKAEGYATSVIKQLTYQVGSFYRWLWEEKGQYTTEVTTDDADAYMREIARDDEVTAGHKDTAQKCLKRLLRYRETELGKDHDWEPRHSFNEPHSQPRDFLSVEERQAIREAALEYGSIPHYGAITPEERDRWKAHLAQRFEKPKSAVGPDDFDRANGWKVPSLVWTSLDAGLRPIEVGRAKTYWVDTDNMVLRIPREEASKKAEDNWTVALSERTASALDRWLRERQQYDKYEDRDALWLTKVGTTYGSQSLLRLLQRLCDVAGIDTEHRKMSWYTIRHSVGTYLVREEDLAAAQSQLRHKSPETTMKYDQVPVEDRRDALNKMG